MSEYPDPIALARSLAEMLDKAKQPHDAVYVQTITAMHSTVSWLLGTSTAANSAGFYFAMQAPDHWITAVSAGLFISALAATLSCGVLIVRVHANDAGVADLWRKMDVNNVAETQDAIEIAQDASQSADTWLLRASIASVFFTLSGGLALVAAKVMGIMS